MSVAKNFSGMEKGFDLGQAIAEAERCLLCHDAPCSKGCPAKTDPGLFIRKLRMKNITGSIRTIKENNILGGACGVLCPTARLCEKNCSTCGIDRSIQIGKLQRFLVEHSWETRLDIFAPPFHEKPKPRPGKIAIIGGGPAGISCAAELAKNGHAAVIFEKMPRLGGVLRYGVPSFRFDDEFLDQDLNGLKTLGVTVKCSSPISGQKGVEKLLKSGFEAVFIACGLWKSIRLNGDEREIPGVHVSTEFLSALRENKFKELGKSLARKDVAVIGGGSVAIDCARAAVKLGARDVFLLYRRSYVQMPAEEDEKLEALHEGIHFMLLNQPLEYIHKRGKLHGIRMIRTELGAEDASGRRSPVNIAGSEWVLPVQAAVEAIGNEPEQTVAELHPFIAMNRGKTIQTGNNSYKTSHPGIFAGGDIVRGPSLVVDAIWDGKEAAKAIMRHVARGGKKS